MKKTLQNSMRSSIIQIDAFRNKSLHGFLYVDLDGATVTAAYFEEHETENVYKLRPDTKISVISDVVELTYTNITGRDVIETMTLDGQVAWAGVGALLAISEAEALLMDAEARQQQGEPPVPSIVTIAYKKNFSFIVGTEWSERYETESQLELIKQDLKMAIDQLFFSNADIQQWQRDEVKDLKNWKAGIYFLNVGDFTYTIEIEPLEEAEPTCTITLLEKEHLPGAYLTVVVTPECTRTIHNYSQESRQEYVDNLVQQLKASNVSYVINSEEVEIQMKNVEQSLTLIKGGAARQFRIVEEITEDMKGIVAVVDGGALKGLVELLEIILGSVAPYKVIVEDEHGSHVEYHTREQRLEYGIELAIAEIEELLYEAEENN